MNDSAGKFCLDKWTREEKEDRVEGNSCEKVRHETVKEDQDVAARPTTRTHSRSDPPDRSGKFSERNPGHASARCAGVHLSGCRFCRSVSQTRAGRRSALETGISHGVPSAGKPLRPSSGRDGARAAGLEICALVASR